MVDPVALTASVIVDLAARKFVESGAGKLAEKFTESAIQKMGELWQQIKKRLGGKSEKLDEAMVKVEQGDCNPIGIYSLLKTFSDWLRQQTILSTYYSRNILNVH
jgi:hypothetical protein